MGPGMPTKCVAHSEAPLLAKRPRSPATPDRPGWYVNGVFSGNGTKEQPVELLDSPLWCKDRKDFQKMLALWYDYRSALCILPKQTGVF